MKLLIVGPRGKMGRLITKIASENPDIELVGGVAPKGRDYIGADLGDVALLGKKLGVNVYDDIEDIIDACDVIVDFSTREEAMVVIKAAVAHKKALVCGTTGFSEEERNAFKKAGESIPVMLAANTSRMVNLMYELLAKASKALPADVDIDIVDMHDKDKRDAPSGTAKEMCQIIMDASPGRNEINFHSLRGGDTPSSHIVHFLSNGERLEISHHSTNWMCFASGAVEACLFIYDKPNGLYKISDVMK